MTRTRKTHVDLFTGIGGFALAAQANGLTTVAMCEIDDRCRDFLGKSWPDVKDIHDDVRKFDGTRYAGATLLTAGVPCQPASRAGKQAGAADDRWLWPEALRVLDECRPRWALFENPSGIRDVGLDGILSDVEGRGYRVGVAAVPACAVDAPHRRERLWIICRRMADSDGKQRGANGGQPVPRADGRDNLAGIGQGDMADTSGEGRRANIRGACSGERETPRRQGDSSTCPGNMADAASGGQRADGGAQGRTGHAHQRGEDGVAERCDACGELLSDAFPECLAHTERERRQRRGTAPGQAQGPQRAAPGLRAGGGGCVGDSDEAGREGFGGDGPRAPTTRQWSGYVWQPCADGKLRRAPDDSFDLVDGLHRSVLAALGNSIVPQVAERIIAAMMQADTDNHEQGES